MWHGSPTARSNEMYKLVNSGKHLEIKLPSNSLCSVWGSYMAQLLLRLMNRGCVFGAVFHFHKASLCTPGLWLRVNLQRHLWGKLQSMTIEWERQSLVQKTGSQSLTSSQSSAVIVLYYQLDSHVCCTW